MKIVVTNNTIEYEGFLKVRTLEEAVKTLGTIEALVYHKSNEPIEKKVEYLTQMKDRVGSFVYIRNKDSFEQAVQMIVVGSGGKYFDDEFFLESGAELNNLVSNLSEVTQLAELGGVGVMSDFFNKYLTSGSSGFNKAYLQVVKNAVSGMLTEYKQKDAELLQMSETATELFSNSMQLLSGVEEEKVKLQEAVKTLEEARDKGLLMSSAPVASSVYFFPRVPYLKERSIIRIKEIGTVPYLTSFVLGFRLYLERLKFQRPKLVCIYPVGDQFEQQFKNYVWITQQNNKTMRSFYSDIVFVNYPSKEVMTRLLDDDKHDVIIVVDRMKLGTDHLLNCKGSSVKYAVSGNSVIKNLNLKTKDCFSPSAVTGSMFQLKYDPKYKTEADQRERYYLKEYSTYYDSMYQVKKI